MNILRSLVNYCELSTDDCINTTRCHYADHNGVMITYPYYINDNINCECENKIIYDPRIQPVSDLIS